jgi:hypothetical protein
MNERAEYGTSDKWKKKNPCLTPDKNQAVSSRQKSLPLLSFSTLRIVVAYSFISRCFK